MKLKASVLLLAAVVAGGLDAQAPLDHVPKSRLERLARGVNSLFWSVDYPNNAFGQSDADFLRTNGLTYVRLMLSREQVTPSLNPPSQTEKALARLDQNIDILLSNGVGVMLTLFQHNALPPLLTAPAAVNEYNLVLSDLAARYRSRDPELLFFEILNEPAEGLTESEWESIQRRFAKTIRAAAPSHTIIATSADYSQAPAFLGMEPLEDPNVVYAFHFYPSTLGNFIFQGHTCCGVEKIKGLPYPSHLPEVSQFLLSATDPDVKKWVADYIAGVWWAGHIEREVEKYAAWGRGHGRPVVLNEYNLSTTYAPPESRQRYNWDVRRAAERAGVGWAAFHYFGDGTFQIDSLMKTQASSRVPDPLLMAALGLTPWSGPVLPRPEITFNGGDSLTSDRVVPEGTFVSATSATDLDGDGLPDLVATPARFPETGGETVVILKNQGGGGMSNVTASSIAGAVPKTLLCRRIVTADLNGDGRPDLFFADQGQSGKGTQSRLLLSGPDGRYIDSSGNLPQQVAATTSADAADTRGNGLVDLILFNDQSATRAPLQLLSNDGQGRFTVDNGRLPSTLTDVRRSDNVFVDGRFVKRRGSSVPDLVLVGGSGVASLLLQNDGSGRFTIGPSLPAKPFGGNAYAVSMVADDLDGDGAVDLVIGYQDAQREGAYVQILMNNGDGTFRDETTQRITQPTLSKPLGSLSLSPATGKNGALLLVVFGGGPSILKTLDSAGRFVDVPLDLTDGYNPTILVDLNQDGLADIVTAITARVRFGAQRVEVSPAVKVQSPWDGNSFKGPGDVSLAATPNDPASSIAKIDFLQGDLVVAQSAQAPWTATWTGAPLGTFDLTARVTRKDGSTATSAPVQVSVTPTGDPVTASKLVPIVLDVDNGTDHFTTDLVATNRGATTAFLSMTYTAALGSKAGSGSISYVLAPGSDLRTSNVLDYLRRRGLAIPAAASEPAQGGSLLVQFEGASSSDAVSVAARTSALTRAPQPIGRAGTAYLGLGPEEASSDRLTVYGLRSNATDRTNLAVFSTSPDPVSVRVTVYSGTTGGGSAVVANGLTLPAYGWTQLNRILDGPGFTNGYALVERLGGGGTFSAYGIVNDNATGDGSFLPPTASSSGRDGLTVPVLVETSSFRSELALANSGSAQATFRLSYAESLSPAGGSGGSMTVLLAPGEQRIIPEAIDVLRKGGISMGTQGAASYAGALRVTVSGVALDRAYVGARTASPSPGGGQFGLFTPPVYQGQEAADVAYVYGLRADASSRSNLAVLHAGADADKPITLRVQLFDGASGGIAKGNPIEIQLDPGKWTQLSNPLAQLGIESGWARITRTTGSAPWIAYGVVNDGAEAGKGTGDGAYLPMAR